MAPMIEAAGRNVSDTTLGILAGGLATRLGGIDKAWMERDGQPQVLRISEVFRDSVREVIVSANRSFDRYAQAGLRTVGDRHVAVGPLGGLHALSLACTTPWLLTLPVDVLEPETALAALRDPHTQGQGQGACLEDAQGLQPLVALWKMEGLSEAIDAAIASQDHSVQALQHRLGMQRIPVRLAAFGNLNTREDARAAGIEVP